MRNIKKENTDAVVEKENELIRLVKQGNRQAFTELISLYQKRIFKVAYGFFQNRDDAMEIVQETFLRIYEKIDRFDNHSSFKNWVYRIAYNLCIDYYRKFKSKKKNSNEISEFDNVRSDDTIDPEVQLDRDNFQANLLASLETISKRQKMVFVMKHYNSLKFREIAEILNISVGTAKSLHHRAAKSLKQKLAHYEVTA